MVVVFGGILINVAAIVGRRLDVTPLRIDFLPIPILSNFSAQ